MILQMVRVANPAVTEAQAQAVEQQVRAQYGGIRTRIPKRKKHPTSEERARVFAQAMTDVPDERILSDNGISRRSLYRYLKRGGE